MFAVNSKSRQNEWTSLVGLERYFQALFPLKSANRSLHTPRCGSVPNTIRCNLLCMDRIHSLQMDELETKIATLQRREKYLRAMIRSALVAAQVRREARQELDPLLVDISQCEEALSQLETESIP